MNETKIIEAMVKHSTLVKDSDIELNEEDFIDLPLKEFYELNGELWFSQEKDIFYKFMGGKWFRFKNRKEAKPIIEQNIIKDYEERYAQIQDWCKKMGLFTNHEFEIIKKRLEKLELDQQEFFRQMKENVDLQIKIATQKEEQNGGKKTKRVQGNKGN